jgi:hypothetical protein
MIPERDNQSIRSTKMEMANQKWSNLGVKLTLNPVSVHYAPWHSCQPLSPLSMVS